MDKKFASRTDVANILGIHRMTFSGYCTGRRNVTNVDIRKKLFDLTGIETFKSDKPDKQDSVLLTTWADLYIETLSNRKNDHNIYDSKTSVEGVDTHIDGNKCDDVIMPKKEDLRILTTGKNNLGGVDRPFIDIATDLRNWFNNQHMWQTQGEVAEHVGASHSSMKKVFQGVKKPEGIVKQKLYELTQLECFRDDEQEKDAHVEEENVCTDEAGTCADKVKLSDGATLSACDVDKSSGSKSSDIATDLRNWFNNQHKWKKTKEIAEHIGVSNSSMKKVFQGSKKPEGIVKQKLYELTKLECLRDGEQGKDVNVEEVKVCEDGEQGKDVNVEEVKVRTDEADTCVDKAGLHIYEVETSIGKKNGHTKKMNIPIHEVDMDIVATNEPASDMSEPVSESNSEIQDIVEEVPEHINDVQESVNNVQKLLEEVRELVVDTNIPIEEVEEHISEAQEPVSEVYEPVTEVEEPIGEIQELVVDTNVPIEEVKEPIVEVQESAIEVPESVTEVKEPIGERQESVTEVPESVIEMSETVAEVQTQYAKEVPESVIEMSETVAEVQTQHAKEAQKHTVEKVRESITKEVHEPVYQVQLQIRGLKKEKLDKNYHVDGLRGLADYIEGLEQEIKLLRSNKKNGNKKGSGDEVEKLTNAFYSLAKVLKSFKNCTPEQRKKVKNKIHAQDFGYVTSFMKAMYDEQSFADFMFFADYELKGDSE